MSLTIIDSLRASWTLKLVRRTLALSHPLGAVAGVVAASAALGPETAFGFVVDEAGERPIERTAAALAAEVAALPDEFARTRLSPVTLSTGGADPIALTYSRDPMRAPQEDVVRITLRAGRLTPARMWQWLRVAAAAYNADAAWIETFAAAAFADERRRRQSEADESPDMRPFLPPPPPIIAAHAPLADRFARAVAASPDRLGVPDMVWWANAWSSEVVARVGRGRIDAAPWHAVELWDDGLLLVATADPPDDAHPQALERIADILERLDLPSVVARELG